MENLKFNLCKYSFIEINSCTIGKVEQMTTKP